MEDLASKSITDVLKDLHELMEVETRVDSTSINKWAILISREEAKPSREEATNPDRRDV